MGDDPSIMDPRCRPRRRHEPLSPTSHLRIRPEAPRKRPRVPIRPTRMGKQPDALQCPNERLHSRVGRPERKRQPELQRPRRLRLHLGQVLA